MTDNSKPVYPKSPSPGLGGAEFAEGSAGTLRNIQLIHFRRIPKVRERGVDGGPQFHCGSIQFENKTIDLVNLGRNSNQIAC